MATDGILDFPDEQEPAEDPFQSQSVSSFQGPGPGNQRLLANRGPFLSQSACLSLDSLEILDVNEATSVSSNWTDEAEEAKNEAAIGDVFGGRFPMDAEDYELAEELSDFESGSWISPLLTVLRTAQVTSHFSARYLSRIAPPRVPVEPSISKLGIGYFSKP